MGWTKECLQEWGTYTRVAIPSMVMICLVGAGAGGGGCLCASGARRVACALVAIVYRMARAQGLAARISAVSSHMPAAWTPPCTHKYATQSRHGHTQDWWTFEIIVILSGLLPRPEMTMSMMGITFNVHALCFFAAHGLSGAASTRVGNELGGSLWAR